MQMRPAINDFNRMMQVQADVCRKSAVGSSFRSCIVSFAILLDPGYCFGVCYAGDVGETANCEEVIG